jgi:hypothetical protein
MRLLVWRQAYAYPWKDQQLEITCSEQSKRISATPDRLDEALHKDTRLLAPITQLTTLQPHFYHAATAGTTN